MSRARAWAAVIMDPSVGSTGVATAISLENNQPCKQCEKPTNDVCQYDRDCIDGARRIFEYKKNCGANILQTTKIVRCKSIIVSCNLLLLQPRPYYMELES